MSQSSEAWLHKPFRYYLKKHWPIVTLGLGSLFLTNTFETLVPWLIGKTLDQITTQTDLSAIAQTIGRIFIVIIFLSIFRFLWRLIWGTFHHSVAEDLRNRIFAKFTLLGPAFYRSRKTGELMSLISNDVNSFRMGIGAGLLVLFDSLSLAALILPIMISISWRWTWQSMVLMPIIPILISQLLRRLNVAVHERQQNFSEMSGAAQEIVSGIRVIKSFAQEDNQTRLFNVSSEKFRKSCDRITKWDSMFSPAMELPVALGCVFLLILGAPEVVRGAVTLGSFFAFYQYLQRMAWPMEGLGIAFGQIQEARAAFARIRNLLQQTVDIPDHGTLEVTELQSLEVRNLTFKYPNSDHYALKNVSFHLQRGECLGVIGATGSGKSTLIELLCRQYYVPSGTILINNISIEKIRLSSLRALIGLVPQEAFLFSRRVSENLALGRDSWSLDDVRSAAKTVRLDQEIEGWNEAYDSMVGERGVNLSGGQKQRMTLARALMRDAPLVILDDALSAVDGNTEREILRGLKDELFRTTSIIVSHRLASVRWADKILVFKDGELLNTGKHEDLLTHSPTYRILSEMQSELEVT